MTTTAPVVTNATDDSAITREADERVARICGDVIAGRRTDRSARAEVATILCGTNILAEVAGTANANPAEREELEESLRQLMLRKILVPNGDKHLNFELLADKSACGWFRQFARTARQSELRNLRNSQRRFGIPMDMHSPDQSGLRFADLAAPEAVNTPYAANLAIHKSAEELAHDESANQLIESYTETARYLRGSRVTFIKADVLRRFFNLPSPTRLPSPTDRTFVLDQLTADEKTAYRSASIAFRLRTGEIEPDEVTTDPRLIDIWSTHDVESLDSLLERPGEVAHTLAIVASMQRPRPNSVALDRFRRLISVISEVPGWSEVVKDLVDAYIATEFSALNAYNEHRLSENEIAELSAKHLADQKKWKPAVKAVANFAGSPMGSTEAQIRRSLDNHATAAGAIESFSFTKDEKKAKKATSKKAAPAKA